MKELLITCGFIAFVVLVAVSAQKTVRTPAGDITIRSEESIEKLEALAEAFYRLGTIKEAARLAGVRRRIATDYLVRMGLHNPASGMKNRSPPEGGRDEGGRRSDPRDRTRAGRQHSYRLQRPKTNRSMSKELIEAIEDGLKAGITQKTALSGVADKVRKAKPLAENEFDFDSPPALLLKEAEMCLRRAHREAEQATRKMARAIAFIDENAETEEASQAGIFDDEEAPAQRVTRQLNPPAAVEDADYELIDDDDDEEEDSYDDDLEVGDVDDPFGVEDDDDFDLDDDVAQMTALECVRWLRDRGEGADKREGVQWLRRRVQRLQNVDESEPEVA